MKTYRVHRAFLMVGAVFFSLTLFASNGFPWGSATHANIDDRIGKKLRLCNLNEIYGAMAADIFNLSPDVLDPSSPIYSLYLKAHFGSLKVWGEAQRPAISKLGKAAAFGFVSHDNLKLGADYTAHTAYGDGPGYVIAKADTLAAHIGPALTGPLGLPETVVLELCHILVEYAIDIMVVYDLAPNAKTAQKMMASSMFRSPELPLLLVKAYAADLAEEFPGINRFKAAQMIISAEREFRKTIIVYGQALTQQDKSDAVESVAMLLASLAQEIYGIAPDDEVTEDVIISLAKDGLGAAMTLCADFDIAIQDTVNAVKANLREAGIQY